MNIKEKAEKNVTDALNSVEKAENDQLTLLSLPEDILLLEPQWCTAYDKSVSLEFTEDTESIRKLFSDTYKFHDWKKNFSTYNGLYSLVTKGTIGDISLTVVLNRVTKPEGCRVESYQVETTCYRSICNEEGELQYKGVKNDRS